MGCYRFLIILDDEISYIVLEGVNRFAFCGAEVQV